jgi:hypothetical protein
MDRLAKVSRAVVLSVSLCCAGCTNSPRKDVSAMAVGTGVGALVCVATLFACPVVLAAGAGGGMLIRKVNVTRQDQCMRAAPRNPGRFRARQEYCDR